jgi:hypothetical protein
VTQRDEREAAMSSDRTPSERLMDDVQWKELELPEDRECGLWATHEGEFEVGGITLRCYTLNDGRRILDAEDIHKHFFPEPQS